MSSAPMNDDDALLVADNADTGFSNHLAALKKLAEVVRRQHAEIERLRACLMGERERCAVIAWNHYMDTCRKTGRAPSMWHEWCASDAIRQTGEKT